MTCSEQGCGKKARGRGLCMAHYHQKRRTEEPEYDRRYMYKCRKCSAWIASLDLCVSCRVLSEAIKRDKWSVKKLEYATYYRREVGKVIIRIYDGPTVRWEMEGAKFRQGRARSVIDAIRRVRENEAKIKTRKRVANGQK